MVDKFTILLPHLLMAMALWRLFQRGDLDRDPLADPPPPQFLRRPRPTDDAGDA